ncbi:transposase [Variovorax sp. LG9.2]|nr:transposase [Variovorax sp. LG9.2]
MNAWRHAGAPGAASIGKVFAVEAEIRGKPPHERMQVRQARTAAMLGDLKEWFNTTLSQVSAKSPMALAIGYSLSNWMALTSFVDDGRIEAHKGMSIEDLQIAKKQADDGKTWLDNMTKAGGGASISREATTSIAGLQTATSSALAAAIARQKADERNKAVQTAEGAAGASTSHSVTINVGGRQTTIGTASADDASSLAGVLRGLGAARRVS